MRKILVSTYKLLTVKERREGAKVAASVLAGALLDFLSLATLLPILYYLLEGGQNLRAALLFCGLALVVSLLKYFAGSAFTRTQNRYLLGLYKRLSLALYNSYFHKGLLFIRKHSISRLGHDINGICYAFSQSILSPILKMSGDIMLIFLVALALLIYSPITALVLLIAFLPFAWVYLRVIRRKAKELGDKELAARREQARIVHDTFGGYAELQVGAAFGAINKQFSSGIDQISDNRLQLTMLMRLPLLLSELAVVLGLGLVAAFGTGDVKLLIGVFAVAAFRLLPAVRSVLSGMTVVQNAQYCLDVISSGLEEDTQEGKEQLSYKSSISFEDLDYSYPDGEQVFTGLNLNIKKGEYLGFRGDSGGGKSTLFNLLLGFIEPSGGRILIDGMPLSNANRASWLQKIGYVPQDVFIFTASLADNLDLGSSPRDDAKMLDLIKALQLDDWFKSLSDGLDTILGERGGTLSGGQKQRIGIARALYRDVELLLLDEASSSLDNANEAEILAIIDSLRERKPELTVLSIAHRESSLANCDRIVNI